MKIVEINNRFYSIPESWNELTFSQLKEVLSVLKQDDDSDVLTIHLLKVLIDIEWWRLWVAGSPAIDDKLYLVEWIFDGNGNTKNLLLTYKGYYGPADNFDNLLISEFVFTEQFFMLYRNEETPALIRQDALNKLVAILYRKSKWFYNKKINAKGDIRKKFNDHVVSYDAKKIAKWDPLVKEAIAHWYDGCRNQLIKDFPEPFSKGDGAASTYGLWDVIYGVAEKGVLGDFEKVEWQYLKTVMMTLTKTIQEFERLPKPVMK